MARCIRRRLDDLRAAGTLSDVRGLPVAVATLGDKRLGQFHLAVHPPHGVIFELIDEGPTKRGADLDWAQVTAIRVLGIGTADG